MIRSFRARRICGLLHWLFVSLGLVSVGHALPNQLDVEGILLSGIDMKMVDGTCALSSSLYAAEEVVKALCSEGTLTLQSVTGAIRYPWAKELQIDVVDAHGPERSHQSVYSGVSPLDPEISSARSDECTETSSDDMHDQGYRRRARLPLIISGWADE